jgi:hypothetical protein
MAIAVTQPGSWAAGPDAAATATGRAARCAAGRRRCVLGEERVLVGDLLGHHASVVLQRITGRLRRAAIVGGEAVGGEALGERVDVLALELHRSAFLLGADVALRDQLAQFFAAQLQFAHGVLEGDEIVVLVGHGPTSMRLGRAWGEEAEGETCRGAPASDAAALGILASGPLEESATCDRSPARGRS